MLLSKNEKARLTWHCRRGMLELDLILNQFLESQLDSLDAAQIKQFESLLEHTDPELFAWLMGHEIPPSTELTEIVNFIRTQS